MPKIPIAYNQTVWNFGHWLLEFVWLLVIKKYNFSSLQKSNCSELFHLPIFNKYAIIIIDKN